MKVLVIGGPREGDVLELNKGARSVQLQDPWRMPDLGEPCVKKRFSTMYTVQLFEIGHPDWAKERFTQWVAVPWGSTVPMSGQAVLATLTYLFNLARSNPKLFNI